MYMYERKGKRKPRIGVTKKKKKLYTVRPWPRTRQDVRTLSKVRFCVFDFVSNRVDFLPAEQQQQRPPLPGRGRGGGGGMGPGGDNVLQVRKEYIGTFEKWTKIQEVRE